MEFLTELLLDLILEGSLELAKSKKVPKGIRILLIAFLSLVILGMLVGVLVLAVYLILRRKDALDIALGSILIFLDGVMIFSVARKMKAQAEKRKRRREASEETFDATNEKKENQ